MTWATGATLLLGAAILLAILPFVSGLMGALVLFVVARPLHTRLRRRVPERVSAFAIALALFAALLIPGMWLLTRVLAEGRDAVRSWHGDQLIAWLQTTPLRSLAASRDIGSLMSAVVGWLSPRAILLVGGATTTMLNAAIALFGSYYLLLDGPALWRRVKRLLPVSTHTADLMASQFANVTEGLLLGTVATAALQGTLVGAGFALVGLPGALLWGFVTACASVMPLFGSALVWGPGVVVLLVQHRTPAALFLAVLGGGVASNIDNVIRPIVYRRVSNIHPLTTLVGAFAGVSLFGLVGLLLGPLAISYFFELLKIYREEYQRPPAQAPAPLEPAVLSEGS